MIKIQVFASVMYPEMYIYWLPLKVLANEIKICVRWVATVMDKSLVWVHQVRPKLWPKKNSVDEGDEMLTELWSACMT